MEGALGVGGRKVPFISPIPSKNSSLSSACHFAKTRLLTWNDLEQVWAITPYILSVVYDDHHTLIRREQSLQVLGGEICSSAWLLHRKRSRGLTSTLISTQYPVPKDLALWVDHSADRIGISPSSHCVDVHLVKLRHGIQELLQSRSDHQYLPNHSQHDSQMLTLAWYSSIVPVVSLSSPDPVLKRDHRQE